jgi:23S rRNA (cytosine1962-C5)-methyltransferase
MTILLPIADGEDKTSPLANCIRNNYRHLRKWAKRTGTDAFRVYEKEISQFPLVIDYYAGFLCVQFFSSSGENQESSPQLVEETEAALQTVFGISRDAIFWRTRSKRKETRQYEKRGESKDFFVIYEYGLKFQINLLDYLDTGLFLDHRETRRLIAAASAGKRVLNLFAYTCSFSVHAAAAGAIFTKSVDMSNTYTAWGRTNFELNALPSDINPIVRADCLKFLIEEASTGIKYDIIIIDPPTISRSKKMGNLFDIQVDYPFLISQGLKLLSDTGFILFSTNSRKFRLDDTLFPSCSIADISEKTLPVDFRDPKIHRCWKISTRI